VTQTITVRDADSQLWKNGTWSVFLSVPPGQFPPSKYLITLSQVPVPNQTQAGAIDGSGLISLTVTPNDAISPANTIWTMSVCPNATSQCFQQSFSFTVTSSVTITPPAIRIPIANQPPRVTAYADGEITGCAQGNYYYNTTDNLIHYATNNTNCGWTTLSAGSGSVTSFSSGNLTPLFTTSVSNPTTTPALSFAFSNANAGTVFGNNTGSPASPVYYTPNITGGTGINVSGSWPSLVVASQFTLTGTLNKVAQWTSTTALGSSSLSDDSTTVSTTEALSALSLTATGLTPGGCVQAGSGGLLTTPSSTACGGGGGGITGSGTAGRIMRWNTSSTATNSTLTDNASQGITQNLPVAITDTWQVSSATGGASDWIFQSEGLWQAQGGSSGTATASAIEVQQSGTNGGDVILTPGGITSGGGHDGDVFVARGNMSLLSSTQANLGTPAHGNGLKICSNCSQASGASCASGGTGALAAYFNGSWHCF
jgi:hypothetical protein